MAASTTPCLFPSTGLRFLCGEDTVGAAHASFFAGPARGGFAGAGGGRVLGARGAGRSRTGAPGKKRDRIGAAEERKKLSPVSLKAALKAHPASLVFQEWGVPGRELPATRGFVGGAVLLGCALLLALAGGRGEISAPVPPPPARTSQWPRLPLA